MSPLATSQTRPRSRSRRAKKRSNAAVSHSDSWGALSAPARLSASRSTAAACEKPRRTGKNKKARQECENKGHEKRLRSNLTISKAVAPEREPKQAPTTTIRRSQPDGRSAKGGDNLSKIVDRALREMATSYNSKSPPGSYVPDTYQIS